MVLLLKPPTSKRVLPAPVPLHPPPTPTYFSNTCHQNRALISTAWLDDLGLGYKYTLKCLIEPFKAISVILLNAETVLHMLFHMLYIISDLGDHLLRFF